MSVSDLYRVVLGASVYTMTSADAAVLYPSGPLGALEKYVPTEMGRSGITIRNELTKANMQIRLPLDHPLVVAVLSSWLEVIAPITVFRYRASGTAVIWKGRLSASQPDDSHCKLIFESIFTSMRRTGARARYLKMCRHALYGRGCNLDPEDFASLATLDAIVGRTLTVPEAALLSTGWLDGGMVRAPDGALSYIQKHVGSALTINRVSGSLVIPFAAEGPGMAITLYPGCDHKYATCESKFANDSNYGGFDHIPSKNPMGGMSIV